MGGFVLVRKDSEGKWTSILKNAANSMEEQGFSLATEIDNPDFSLLLYPKQLGGVVQSESKRESKRFCTLVGTYFYKGKSGPQAIRQLQIDAAPDIWNSESWRGSYCGIIRRDDETWLFQDKLGTYLVYADSALSIISSSFLAVASTVKRPNLNPQAMYEYVFQGATYGADTVLKEVVLLDNRKVVHIDSTGIRFIERSRTYEVPVTEKIEDRVTQVADFLADYFSGVNRCYGNGIDTALSAGFDSRLILALVLQAGIDPAIHVYGSPLTADVRIANTLCSGEDLAIKQIDKSSWSKLRPACFVESVQRNFLAFDGLPTDGVFSDAADLETRLDRMSNNSILLNGGGGEIFRNFFFLHDRSYSCMQLVSAFYSQYSRASCRSIFDERQYRSSIAKKIADQLGVDPRSKLDRWQIELAYPLFRCKFWMGKNNSINNRFGMMLTPLVEPRTVELAANIPLHLKNIGKFEAMLINRIFPRLARYKTGYGFDLETGPTITHRLSSFINCRRPPFVRRHQFRIRNRFATRTVPYGLTADYVSRVLPDGFSYVGDYFNPDRVSDIAQYNRLCTLELFCQTLGTRS